MDLERNEVVIARRRSWRRALWWGSIIVLCTVITFYFYSVSKPDPEEKPRADSRGAADACTPKAVSQNDETAVAATTDKSGPNQPALTLEPELVEMVLADLAKEAEEILPVRIRKHRAELLAALSKETILRSIENLPNWDDTRVRQMIPVGGYDSYSFLVRFIPKLNRVRKILELTRAVPNRTK